MIYLLAFTGFMTVMNYILLISVKAELMDIHHHVEVLDQSRQDNQQNQDY